MSLYLPLAFKNLSRSKRRTALTSISIVAGVAVLVLGQGFVSGIEENIVVAAESGWVGDVLARPAGYPKVGAYYPLDHLLTVTPEAKQLLDRDAVAWTERTLFSPSAVAGAESLRVRAIGYDPKTDPLVFRRDRWRWDGQAPAPEGDEIAISASVARLLELKKGDPLVLQVRTHKGAINALPVKVSGVVTTGNTALDTMAILVPASLTARLVGTTQPTQVSVKLSHRDDAKNFAPRLQAALGPQAAVTTLFDETRELLESQQVRRKSLGLIVFILLALAGFGMANTILMAAYERVHEVGTLRAMGMTERGVVGLFLAEGGLMGLLGSVLGAALGGAGVAWWAAHPIDLSRLVNQETNGNMAIEGLIYTHFSLTVMLGALVYGLAVSLLASWYPARVASKMAPADAVRA